MILTAKGVFGNASAIDVRVPIVIGFGLGAFAAGQAYPQVVADLANRPGGANNVGTDPLAGSLTILPLILLRNPGRANGGLFARGYPLAGLLGIDTVTPDTEVSSSSDGTGLSTPVGNTGIVLGDANLIPIKVDADTGTDTDTDTDNDTVVTPEVTAQPDRPAKPATTTAAAAAKRAQARTDASMKKATERLDKIARDGQHQIQKVLKDVGDGVQKTVKSVTGSDKTADKTATKSADTSGDWKSGFRGRSFQRPYGRAPHRGRHFAWNRRIDDTVAAIKRRASIG